MAVFQTSSARNVDSGRSVSSILKNIFIRGQRQPVKSMPPITRVAVLVSFRVLRVVQRLVAVAAAHKIVRHNL